MLLSKHFTLGELTVTGSGLPNNPNPTELAWLKQLAVNILQPLRDRAGVPLVVTSGFRSNAVNRAAGGAASSQHRLGQAADFTVAGMAPIDTCRLIIAMGLPFDQLIQEHHRWVHVS